MQKDDHRSYFSRIFWALMIVGLCFARSSLADDLSMCMTEMMQKADDSTTLGELRLQCQEKIDAGKIATKESEPDILSERFSKDEKNVLEPFTLMAHRPNYLLFAVYNSAGYNAEPYQEQVNDATIEVDDTEAQFQLSLKFPLAINLFETMDIYAAYTNRSFWQIYNDSSAPFRETNHEPEAWLQFNSDLEFFGIKNRSNWIGINHQSNGRGGTLSRSWNRVFANFLFEKGNFAFNIKPWFRISEDDEDDDNPDITDYMGHFEWRGAYKWEDHVFAIMSRNNLESGFETGGLELSWSFPLGNYPYLKGYVQYYTGYGSSLIDYDQYVNKIGLGVALGDWL